MLFFIFFRRPQALISLSALAMLLLFAIAGGMQGCGDFELWSEKGDSTNNNNDNNGGDVTISCEDPFPGLAGYEADEVNTLSSSPGEPVDVLVVPDGMSFRFDHDDSTSTDDIRVDEGDLIVVDKGTGSNNGEILVYTYSSADDSTETVYLSGLNEPSALTLIAAVYQSFISYSTDMLFYAFEDGSDEKVNLQFLDFSDTHIEVVSDSTAEFTALAAGNSGDTYALFLLDASSNKVLRTKVDIVWTDIIADPTNIATLLDGWESPTDLFSGASVLKDIVFSPATGSLYVLSSTGVYEITSAVTRSDAIASPSSALIPSSDFSATTPAGLEVIYTSQSADSDAFLIMFSNTLTTPQLQQFDADGDVVTSETFSPLSTNNYLKAAAYDCKNGRLLMTSSPRTLGTTTDGFLYEAPNP